MDEQSWSPVQFERYRGHLQSVAYRMLRSVGEAEHAGEEAWLRLSLDAPRSAVGSVRW